MPDEMTPRAGGRTDSGRLTLAAFLIGFASSGFLDGIVLHQILQWHHLLSALDGDLRFQVVADGWFHVGMYGLAAVGLWRLWIVREALAAPHAANAVSSWGLIGFGAWHVADAVGAHWRLGIHRIRMDAAEPLVRDLAWLAIFGLVPLAAGLWLRSSGTGSGPGRLAAAILVVGAIGAGAWSIASPYRPSVVTVAFADDVRSVDAEAAIAAAGAQARWRAPVSGVFVVADLDRWETITLYRSGALFVGGGGMPDGCFAWTKA